MQPVFRSLGAGGPFVGAGGPLVRVLLALGAAFLASAAIPPLELWPMGWLALAPLGLALRGASTLQGALLGGLFGSAYGVFIGPWFPQMLREYFLVPEPWPWLGSLAVVVTCSGVYTAGLGAWLAWALRAGRGAVSPLLAGAGFAVAEYARAHGFVENPFGLLASSQVAFLPALQVLDLVGPFGLGAVMAAVGFALAGFFAPELRGARPRATGLALVLMVVALLGYGALRLRDEFGVGEPVRVAIVQGGIPNDERFVPERRAANLEHHLVLSREAAAAGARLVLWPEFAAEFDVGRELRLRLAIAGFAREHDLDLLLGALGRDGPEPAARETNSIYLVRGGTWADRYDKVRLMPFSETAALPGAVRDAFGFSAGAEVRYVRSRFGALGLAICSEAVHPDHVRELVAAGAEVLVNPSQDVWFPTEASARQQLFGVTMRAVETRRPLLRPTGTGYSAAIDAHGRIVTAPYGGPALLLTEVRPHDGRTLYARFGDWPVALALLGILADAGLRIRRAAARESDA